MKTSRGDVFERPINRRKSIISLTLLSVLTALPAAAQSPPDAGSLLRDQEQLQQQLPDRLPADEIKEVRPQFKAVEGLKVVLKSVHFTGGASLAGDAELQDLVKGSIGKELDYAGLQALAEEVTRYLRGKGYLLARAYLPGQDITEGKVEIVIIEGRLDSRDGKPAEIRGRNLRIPESRLQAIAQANLGTGEAAAKDKLERTILLINDLPGISANSVLEPGSSPGTSRLVIEVEEEPVLSAGIDLDNFGNRYNGEARANGSLTVKDPFGLADQAAILVSASEDKTTGIVNYNLPLDSRGLRLSISASTLDYKVGKEFADANLKGEALTFSAILNYPFIRSRQRNLSIFGGYEWKAMEDEAAGVTTRDRRVENFSGGLSGRLLDGLGGGGMTSCSASAILGNLDLSRNNADYAADQASAQSDGSFRRYVYSLGRLQKLSSLLSLSANLVGQLASKNLGSSEEFSLGGPTGVQAYPVGEGSGDQGWLAKLELRYDVPPFSKSGRLQLQAFADTGHIRLYHDPYPGAVTNATGKNRYQLSGAGLGLLFSQSDSYSLRLAWAVPIDENPGRSVSGLDADGKAHDSRFWVQGTVVF